MHFNKGKLSLLAIGILSFVSIFMVAAICGGNSASAEGDEPRMISIYDSGSRISVKSDASTVSEALLRAKIEDNNPQGLAEGGRRQKALCPHSVVNAKRSRRR